MQAFHADVKEGWSLFIYRGMVYAKMFYGEMVLYPRGIVSPLNSSSGTDLSTLPISPSFIVTIYYR